MLSAGVAFSACSAAGISTSEAGRPSVIPGGRSGPSKEERAPSIPIILHVSHSQLTDEIAQLFPIDLERLHVEHYRPPQEKTSGPGSKMIELDKPVVERQFRCQCERKEGSSLEADRSGFG
jgi:hypothetical protein